MSNFCLAVSDVKTSDTYFIQKRKENHGLHNTTKMWYLQTFYIATSYFTEIFIFILFSCWNVLYMHLHTQLKFAYNEFSTCNVYAQKYNTVNIRNDFELRQIYLQNRCLEIVRMFFWICLLIQTLCKIIFSIGIL